MKKLFINIIVGSFIVAASPSFASDSDEEMHHETAAPAKSGAEVAKQCVACHGEDGNSPTPKFPSYCRSTCRLYVSFFEVI